MVALFNSIAEHQSAAPAESDSEDEGAKLARKKRRKPQLTAAEKEERAKAAALSSVREKSTAAFEELTAAASERDKAKPAFTNSWARDDFMLDAKMDDWDDEDDAIAAKASSASSKKQGVSAFLYDKDARRKR